MPLYTHVGYRPFTGHIHTGRLYGHRDYAGRRHALNGTANTYSGATYVALCGRVVTAEHDGESFNVWPAPPVGEPGAGAGVTCRRCRKLIEAQKE